LDEGFKSLPYKCPEGRLTVGYGHNLDEPMSYQLAEWILIYDIQQASKIVTNIFSIECLEYLSENRYNVLVNMAFNLGNKLKTFKKMIFAVKKQDYNKAADEMENSKWCKQVKSRCIRLAQIMREG